MKKEKEKKDWYKKRNYLHITNNQDDVNYVKRKVENPKLVAHHAFFPLILSETIERRYKEVDINELGEKIKSHKKLEKGKIISTKKVRPILCSNAIDAHIYSYYSQIISDKYELLLKEDVVLDNAVTAYRKIPIEANTNKGKCNIHFAKDVFNFIKEQEKCVVLAFDIEQFFPSLNHKYLKQIWSKLLGCKSLPSDHFNIYKSITNYSYININNLKNKYTGGFDEKRLSFLRRKGIKAFFESPLDFRTFIKENNTKIYKNQPTKNRKTICGIPQGLPISTVLANLYLLEFDKAIIEKLKSDSNNFYRRYSDDIIVVCKESDYENIRDFVLAKINEFHLNISKAKTDIFLFQNNSAGRFTSFKLNDKTWEENKPLNYLGFEFYGYQTLLKSAKIGRFYRRMKSSIKTRFKRIRQIREKELTASPPLFIHKLNRIYTFKGTKPREINPKHYKLVYDRTTRNYLTISKRSKNLLHRGNFISYAERASKIMEEPKIRKQVRRHYKIFKSYIRRNKNAF